MKGARGPRQSPRTLISLLLYHRKGILNSKNAKDFFTDFAKAFSGGFTEKNAGNGRFGRLLARCAPLAAQNGKKRAAGLFAAADTRKRLNGEVWRTRRSAKVNSYRPAFPGRAIFAEGAERAHRSFRSPPSGRFGPSAQQPTGLALPYGAGRAGSLRPWAQTFLKHPAKKIGVSRAFPAHVRRSRYRRCPACRGRRRRRGGSTPGAGAGEAPRAAARSPTG